MNLFLLDANAIKAAISHCDKHCVKMILETTQLAYTAWHVNRPGIVEVAATVTADPCPHKPYKCTHKNHPSAKWVRAHSSHYKWALQLGFALCKEYTRRYGKVHKCQSHLDRLRLMGYPTPANALVTTKATTLKKRAVVGIPEGTRYFDCAINDDVFEKCAVRDADGRLNGVETYRNYYKTKPTDKWTLKWNKQPDKCPAWFKA
jgi:hypothetical protein